MWLVALIPDVQWEHENDGKDPEKLTLSRTAFQGEEGKRNQYSLPNIILNYLTQIKKK